jgi:hypothetical protein
MYNKIKLCCHRVNWILASKRVNTLFFLTKYLKYKVSIGEGYGKVTVGSLLFITLECKILVNGWECYFTIDSDGMAMSRECSGNSWC